MDMPEDKIAQDIGEAFPEFFDMEGEDYGILHRLCELGKSIESEHQQTLAELEKRLVDKVCGYLEGCDATVEDVEKLIKSTIKDIRGES